MRKQIAWERERELVVPPAGILRRFLQISMRETWVAVVIVGRPLVAPRER